MKNKYIYVLLDTRKPGRYKYGKVRFSYEPFYVGKGFGNRVKWSSIRANGNPFKGRVIAKILKVNLKPEYTLYRENLTHTQSLKIEKKLIKRIGRRNAKTGPLTNLTDGGQGPNGYKHTRLAKKRIAKGITGKKRSKETIRKLREKIFTKEHRRSISISQRKAYTKHRRKILAKAVSKQWKKDGKTRSLAISKALKRFYRNKSPNEYRQSV